MTVVATDLIDIQTCPQDVPDLPVWFAEVTLLARHLRQRGILDAVREQVHPACVRAGHYEEGLSGGETARLILLSSLLPFPLSTVYHFSSFHERRSALKCLLQ
jgi:hypothetical protein